MFIDSQHPVGLGEPITMSAIAIKVGASMLSAGATVALYEGWDYLTGSKQERTRQNNRAIAEAKGQEWVANTKHYYDLCFGKRNWFGQDYPNKFVVVDEKDTNPCACKDLIALYDEVKTTGALNKVGKKYSYEIRINNKPINELADPRRWGAEKFAKKAKNCYPEPQQQQRQSQPQQSDVAIMQAAVAQQDAIMEAARQKNNTIIYVGAGVVASLGVLGIVLMNRK